MSDEGFHEIQLNGKQLVFLFMAATVVSVVIFLCGVMVGRGVVRAQDGEAASAAIEAAADPTFVARPAAPAAATAGDAPLSTQETLTYPDRLEEQEPPAETLRERLPAPMPEPTAGIAAPAEPVAGSAVAAEPARQRLRRPGRRRARARRGRHDRASSRYQGLSGVRDVAGRRAAPVPRTRRKVPGSARGRVDRVAARKGRTVQALDYAVTT